MMPSLTVGNVTARLPIVQGGMAVRISMAPLAAAVAKAGGIGVIAGSGMTPHELASEIRKARELSGGDGIVAVNIMVAVAAFKELVSVALAEGIDMVIAGAGFSRDVFQWCSEAGVPLVPIVGSARVAQLSEKFGAAAVIAEGFEAGGHLGTEDPLEILLPKIVSAVQLPVIAAGGIATGFDIKRFLDLGAAGVQMGSMFAATVESSASDEFKRMYVDSTAEDIVLVKSPVGLPGRAIRNPFSIRLERGDYPEIGHCRGCLKKCGREYCIVDKLIRAQQGDVIEGLVFAGNSAIQVSDVPTVSELIDRLVSEYEAASGKVASQGV